MRNILVANRGEIAWRILRTARALGYQTTAIYSDADVDSPHVHHADRALRVGAAPVADSYLNIPAIVGAALRAGADAVHPGYGLLSENPAFAQACLDAGLTFIGPRPETIRAMGDKRSARHAARALGVACVPGYDGEAQDGASLLREAERIGFPLMVKAAAGGGGRGMRLVLDSGALPEALERARGEAQTAFGDGRLILERAVQAARHVEVQIFGDQHGQLIYLGERDCSLQRRFQKLVEEAPSPAVDAALRQRLGEAAVLIARSCQYVGAGTVELLLEPSGQFYFLEMNTRLQVEHPVTECVTGIDLVAWQLRIAEGEALPLSQAQVTLQGHAIEVRLYAEDPARGFVPATGRILQLQLPEELVRIDHGLALGLVIGPHYDALLGKLIAHGATRELARQRLLAALRALRVLGVTTNQHYLCALLEHQTFIAGEATTDFIETRLLPAPARPPDAALLAIAALSFVLRDAADGGHTGELGSFTNAQGVAWPVSLECGDRVFDLHVKRAAGPAQFEVRMGEQITLLEVQRTALDRLEVLVDSVREQLSVAFNGHWLYLQAGTAAHGFHDITHAPKRNSAAAGSGQALAPMDGNLVALLVRDGDRVSAGDTVAVIEAMKLQLRVSADVTGTVASTPVAQGTQVKARQLLVQIQPDEAG
jgi:geranyl-CoA carboxylase alpha subunit